MTGCPHLCDADGWCQTDTGLMPCPRHRLDDHQRWAAGEHRPTGSTWTIRAPEPEHVTTGRQGLAAARAELARTTEERP
ncbi:MAG: hypothetical protein ACRCW4_00485 [Candidatus Neomicrothrix subdominans]